MEFLKYLLLLLFCRSLAFAEQLNEDPSKNYVLNLPDIVANYMSLGKEVQLEAFGAREVNYTCIFHVQLLHKKTSNNHCVTTEVILAGT